MFRVVFYLLLAVLLISLLRSVIGIIGKSISAALEPSDGASQGTRAAEQSGGELKRDPVCGTYISATTSVKLATRQKVLHFCSTACREKYERRS